EFERMDDAEDTSENLPIKALLKNSSKQIVIITSLGAMITGGYYIASVYAATYLQSVGGHSSQLAFTSTSLAMVVGIGALLLAGQCADRFGRKKMFLVG